MSQTTPIYLDCGDLETFDGTVVDAAGAPVDIQSARIEFGVKKLGQDSAFVIFRTSDPGDGITILDDGTSPNRGKYRVSMLPSQTQVEPGYYVYAVRVIYGPNDEHTVVRGTALFSGNAVPS